jgi:hypothetical protein
MAHRKLWKIALVGDAGVASCSLPPHVAMMKTADAGHRHHLRVR